VVLAINVVMFLIEVGAGLAVGSASLQADALDFLGDAGNYAISLFVVNMKLRYRATAAFVKGATMGVFGLWVLSVTAWHAWAGTLPHALTMGIVGVVALFANALSFALLWAHRTAMPTCVRHGFARVTTCSAILPWCSRPWAYLALALVGLT
jgi:Co/Zn/Cd efflux system component